MREHRIKEKRLALQLPLSEDLRQAAFGLLEQYLAALRKVFPAPAAERIAPWIRAHYRSAASKPSYRPGNSLEALETARQFLLPRDLVKVWIPCAEWLAVNGVPGPGENLRVLDRGAGIGASSAGLLLLASAAGVKAGFEISLEEENQEQLETAARVVAEAAALTGLKVKVSTGRLSEVKSSRPKDARGRHDLIFCSNALGNTAPEMDAVEAGLVAAQGLVRMLSSRGLLIMLEQALFRVSRSLSAVRDRLVQAEVPVFAPCVCSGNCPELAGQDSFCFHSIKAVNDPYLQKLGDLCGVKHHEVDFCYLSVGAAKGRLDQALMPASVAPFRIISFPQTRPLGIGFVTCATGGLERLWLPRWLETDAGERRTKHLPHGALVGLPQSSEDSQ